MKTNSKEPKELLKFREDKGLERVNALYSSMNLFFNVAMAFSAEAESIMESYHLNIREIRYVVNSLNKEHEKFNRVMRDFYGKEAGMRIFANSYDLAVKDMYRYCTLSLRWKAGQDTPQSNIGVQNLINESRKNRGRKMYRYIGRTKKGELYVTTKADGNAPRHALPNKWFKSIKNGEFTKVDIEPLMKFGKYGY